MQPIIVGCTYLVLCSIAAVQLLRCTYSSTSRGFQFLFLLHCFLWTILRAIFWINLSQLSHLMDTILYWSPVGIQFSTFTLLVAFYAQGVYWREYRRYRRRFHVLCLVLDSIITALLAVCIVLTSTAPGYRMGSDVWLVTGVLSGTLYIVLLCAGAYYGARLVALFHSPKLPANLTSRGKRFFIVASTLYMLGVFGSHAAWDFAAAARGDVDETMKKQVASAGTAARLAGWELIPIAWLLYYFRSIGSSDYGPTLDAAEPTADPLRFTPAAVPVAPEAVAAVMGAPPPAAAGSPPLLEGSVPQGGLARGTEREPLLGDRARTATLFLNERRYDSDDEGAHHAAAYGPAGLGSRTPSYGSLSSLSYARSASAHVAVPHRSRGIESDVDSPPEALSPVDSRSPPAPP